MVQNNAARNANMYWSVGGAGRLAKGDGEIFLCSTGRLTEGNNKTHVRGGG